MLATLAAVCALLGVILVSIGQATFAIPVAILFAILIAAGMFDAFAARRKVARHCGDIDSVEADEGDTFPTMVANEQAPGPRQPASRRAPPKPVQPHRCV